MKISHPTIQSKLSDIELRQAESRRLRETLVYYGWLENWGLSWDVIKSIAVSPISACPKTRREFRESCEMLGCMDAYEAACMHHYIQNEIYFGGFQRVAENYNGPATVIKRRRNFEGRFISYMLKDGRKVLVPWPPFDNNVIFNKRVYELPEDQSSTDQTP